MSKKTEWIEINLTEDILNEAEQNVKKYNKFNLFGGQEQQKLAGEDHNFLLNKNNKN